MIYDFDTFYDRKGTACLKFDFAKERHRPEDVLSYWVADMAFCNAGYCNGNRTFHSGFY